MAALLLFVADFAAHWGPENLAKPQRGESRTRVSHLDSFHSNAIQIYLIPPQNMKSTLKLIPTLLLACASPSLSTAGEKITGSNGVEIEFAAIFEATPRGMVALTDPKGSGI